MTHSQTPELIKDLTSGEDCRGDYAFFIENDHVNWDTWELDSVVQNQLNHAPKNASIFFRIILNGIQTNVHGWIHNKEIVQLG